MSKRFLIGLISTVMFIVIAIASSSYLIVHRNDSNDVMQYKCKAQHGTWLPIDKVCISATEIILN